MATDLQDPALPSAVSIDQEKRSALEQVLQTSSFLRADQLRAFLRFVGEMEISGRGEELSEYRIGVEAFGRPSGYSPAEDPVVRRRAVHLREKLDEVYAGELRGAAVRVELPKGRYVPRFVRVAPPPAALAAAAMAAGQGTASRGYRTAHLALAFAGGALAASAAFLAWPRLLTSTREHPFERGTTYEGEAAANVFSGMATPVMGCQNCSGGGRARSIGNGARNRVELGNVRATREGEHEIVIHYLVYGERSFFVSVNGEAGVEVPATGTSWTLPGQTSLLVRLRAGPNVVRIYNDKAWAPDLDRIVVRD